MITGKIILKSATKLTLDKRFSEIAKQAPQPVTPRVQQANVIIPQSRQELFGNRPSAAMGAAARLKKRSINNRLGLGPRGNPMRPYAPPVKRNVFQRITSGNRRRGGGGSGANAYLYGGQSGMGVRLRGEGRINTTRTFRSRTRGFLSNEFIGRMTGNQQRGNRFRPNRGRGNFSRNRNFNRPIRARGGRNNNRGGRGFNRNRNNNNQNNNSNNNQKPNVTREKLDDDLDQYMSKTKLDEESGAMDAV